MKHNKIYKDGKYVPQRMCISCRNIFPKNDMLRVAGFSDGTVKITSHGGRGVYVCKSQACLEKLCKTNGLSRGLKRNVLKDVYEECCAFER